jgi:hypothetical protein
MNSVRLRKEQMIYDLEFYWVDEKRRREPLARQQQIADTLKAVEARARTTMKNVLFGVRRANLCFIKDSKGKMLSAVAGDHKLARKAKNPAQ